MTNKQNQYGHVHWLAKAIVCSIQCILTIIYFGFDPILLLMTVLFYFGTNTLAWLIEELRHIKHRHTKL